MVRKAWPYALPLPQSPALLSQPASPLETPTLAVPKAGSLSIHLGQDGFHLLKDYAVVGLRQHLFLEFLVSHSRVMALSLST